jgi:hypothetical protein
MPNTLELSSAMQPVVVRTHAGSRLSSGPDEREVIWRTSVTWPVRLDRCQDGVIACEVYNYIDQDAVGGDERDRLCFQWAAEANRSRPGQISGLSHWNDFGTALHESMRTVPGRVAQRMAEDLKSNLGTQALTASVSKLRIPPHLSGWAFNAIDADFH